MAGFDIVIPTVGRPSLVRLLESLDDAAGPMPGRVWIVDDRRGPQGHLLPRNPPSWIADRTTVIHSGGGGPAAARNAGWRSSSAPWIAFLDDDVVVPDRWLSELQADLLSAPADVAASQGRIRVPLPTDRRATDWERNVAGLEQARWATADMAYRREVLAAVGGFDERFPRAYREDADLGLRVTEAGWRILRGDRHVVHPVPPADAAVSVDKQAGNADDPLMRALHGSDWRRRADAPHGRRPMHLASVASAGAAALAAAGRRGTSATVAAALWAGLTAEFAIRRIAPGPRTAVEIATMCWTSAVIPFAATAHWIRGVASLPWRLRQSGPAPITPAAILFDRDGTLIHDVPYNGDPDLVQPVAGARQALERLRRLGIATGVVSNQSGVGRGYIRRRDVDAVNRRVEELLGPIDVWSVCPHAPDEGCRCRKPKPALIERAARRLGVRPADCVVIGDIGSDIEAARTAGARAILVPTGQTRDEEIEAAPQVASDIGQAIDLALGIGEQAGSQPRAGAVA